MDDDQQFCLRWNNHQSTLISVFDTLLENGTLVDCTLAAEGKFLKAHKVVLSACSPYFAALLQEQYDKHPIFILKDVKFQELRAMMDYMYRGEVNISQDQLAALLKAAESLQIKGLSDNRTGAAPRPDHHRGMNVPASNVSGATAVSGSGKMSGGYTLEQTKRARIGAAAMDTQEMSGSREGSSSPTRRRRKVRRRSIENAMTEVHDNSNSSQQPNLQQSNANLAGVGAITAAASVLASQQQPISGAALPTGSGGVATATQGTTQQLTTNVTKKTESVKVTSDAMNTENVQQTLGGDEQDMEHIAAVKIDKQNHKQKLAASASSTAAGKDASDLVIEPKSEYDEDGNDETVEDLTLDDEDMGMDDLDQNAGTSQGGEGSSQGYATWQHDRSQDELLLATQEAQQRDPQDNKWNIKTEDYPYKFESSMVLGERFPCAVCGKSYLRKRHLQRHMRDECIGIPPRFSCELCPSRFRRKYHMVRHLTSKHSLPAAIAQQASGLTRIPGRSRSVGHTGDGASSVGSGCDSPLPENLSLRKENYENENTRSPSGMITPPPMISPATYGLTGAITAIPTVASNGNGHPDEDAVVHQHVPGTEAMELAVATGGVTIKPEPVTPSKMAIEEDWKMKFSMQLISNSLLKERLMNSMPFAYNNK